jgi:hypothetical protein
MSNRKSTQSELQRILGIGPKTAESLILQARLRANIGEWVPFTKIQQGGYPTFRQPDFRNTLEQLSKQGIIILKWEQVGKRNTMFIRLNPLWEKTPCFKNVD